MSLLHAEAKPIGGNQHSLLANAWRQPRTATFPKRTPRSASACRPSSVAVVKLAVFNLLLLALTTLYMRTDLPAPSVPGQQFLGRRTMAATYGGSRKAWVTLLSGSNANSSFAVETQLLTVRRYSRHPHVTIVTPDVRSDVRARIAALDSVVLEVSSLSPGWALPPHWSGVFSKMHLWNLTDHADQVAYIDNDSFLIDKAADNIFSECAEELCGAQDGANTTTGGNMLNVGVLVLRPSKVRFHSLLEALPLANSSALFPEQEFLSNFFTASDAQLGLLHPRFNPCTNEGADLVDGILIMHGCGPKKFETLPLCAWALPSDQNRGICAVKAVRTFQDSLVKANPCALKGRTPNSCDADAQCQWCGELVRCKPKKSDCMLHTSSTASSAHLWWHVDSDWAWLSKVERKMAIAANSSRTSESAPAGLLRPLATPLVSLMVLTCNRHMFLKLALEQVCDQSYKKLEVVIVDDTPGTTSSAARHQLFQKHNTSDNATIVWQHLTVRLIRLPQRASVGAKRNIALRAARGEFVLHWDDDDIYPVDRVESQVRVLLSEEAQVTTLAHDYVGFVQDLTFRKFLAPRYSPFLGTLAYHRGMALKIGFADVSHSEDFDFLVRAIRSCHRFSILNTSNVYMRHGGGARNTWVWNDQEREMFFGPKTVVAGVPEYVTPDFLEKYLTAENESALVGSCPLQKDKSPEIEPLADLRMPQHCCSSHSDGGCSFPDVASKMGQLCNCDWTRSGKSCPSTCDGSMCCSACCPAAAKPKAAVQAPACNCDWTKAGKLCPSTCDGTHCCSACCPRASSPKRQI